MASSVTVDVLRLVQPGTEPAAAGTQCTSRAQLHARRGASAHRHGHHSRPQAQRLRAALQTCAPGASARGVCLYIYISQSCVKITHENA